ncbi:hypothetical protein PRIPAC_81938 [Pristionchus pacificus]|uniref:Cytochrome P450 n=1 Tax=Pristionchus pacificus TaxID=54126 RepID=A0A2A6CK27_PRIPA|nr:hypothetical protein PRIPAC_81938 [Pristionchus pacificus]|eukprot:PDM78438.1 cytochrome P450 [Pristionchus pacificus]
MGNGEELIGLAILAYFVLFYRYVRKYPKGPLPLPLIGNLYHLKAETLHEQLHEIGKQYDGCFTVFLPRPVVIFTTFETIKESMVTNGDNFAGKAQVPPESLLHKVRMNGSASLAPCLGATSVGSLLIDYLEAALLSVKNICVQRMFSHGYLIWFAVVDVQHPQTGISVSDGDVWKEQRKVAIRILGQLGLGKNLMEEKINRSMDEMFRQLKDNNDGVTPFDVSLTLQLCIGNIMNETLFGYHFEYTNTERFEYFNGCVSKHLKSIKVLQDNFYVLLVQAWPWTKNLPFIGEWGFKELHQNAATYHDFIEEEVKAVADKYHKDHEPTNFVEAYLVEMEKNPALDLINLHAIAVDFWLAGMETTSTALRWSLLQLMKHPAEQERIRAELISVVGNSSRIDMSHRTNLPYFVASINELLRVANMVSFVFVHRCTEDTVIDGKLIPADTFVYPQLYSVLKDDPIFENPTEYRPSRFLEDDGRTANKKAAERMIAFGMGRRQCAGEALARMELFLVLGTLLLNYRFIPTEPIDLNPVFGTVLVPRPFKCRVEPL